jgi:hypothetical protein
MMVLGGDSEWGTRVVISSHGKRGGVRMLVDSPSPVGKPNAQSVSPPSSVNSGTRTGCNRCPTMSFTDITALATSKQDCECVEPRLLDESGENCVCPPKFSKAQSSQDWGTFHVAPSWYCLQSGGRLPPT